MSDEYVADEELQHYGILHKSGRYPWGSGETEYHRSMDFREIVDGYKRQGIPEKEYAKALGLTVAQLRDTTTIAKDEIVREETSRAVSMRYKPDGTIGSSIKAIADELGMAQPTVRLRLKNADKLTQSTLLNTADVIRKNVQEHDIVDVGKGVEHHLQIADTKMRAAVSVLRDEGYETYSLKTRNVGTKNFTNHLVVVPPGTGFAGARRMQDRIHTMGEWTDDGGETYSRIHEPLSISSRRVTVKFKEDGGAENDGLIYIRPGAKDLSMGSNTYAQVRIMVDGTHFIKGMAVINHDLPEGTDLVFHTPKSRTVGKLGALKPKEDDPDNPFGSVIKRQIVGRDKNGNEKVKSAINLLNEEGDWEEWRKSLPSQMLAKQPHPFIKSQLTTTRDQVNDRLAELDRITNAVVRRKAYEDFADQIDSNAVDLRAASMPRQRTQVIIPMPKMNKTEIYAPNFETGERVVLIRYPHGGRFEIPEVTVNNNNRTAKRLLGNAPDAIGIHPSVATRLSGADFDGDAVIVIPNRSGKIKSVESMGSQARVYEKGLSNFDAKVQYGGFVQSGTDSKGHPLGNFTIMKNTGLEMGKITNLITDMSIQGAKPEHVVRAVKHSMVVIDAEKHKLDYKQSESDNGIKQLKDLYQGKPGSKKRGASTLLSQATAKDYVPDRKLRPHKEGGPIDLETGARQFVPTGKTRSKYDSKTQTYLPEKIPVTKKIKRLDLTDDAYTLVRDKADPVEHLYADHTNEMKALANAARLRAARTVMPKINSRAKEVYRSEVDKLNADLRAAEKQKPLDRRADVIAGGIVKAKRQQDPLLRTEPDRLEKVERQAKATARARLGLTKPVIDVSDRQWDAIMAGAVSASGLSKILKYTDPKQIMDHALPRTNPVMTKGIAARATAMLNAGATNADVAAALGIPLSTLRSASIRGDVG